MSIMSNKLTWADVAHYYTKNDPAPEIYTWIWNSEDEGYWSNAFEPVFDSLPVLREYSSITDREAWELLAIAGVRFTRDDPETTEGARADFLSDYACGIDDVDEFEMTAPALFWFVKHNFNPFGIATWKGVQS